LYKDFETELENKIEKVNEIKNLGDQERKLFSDIYNADLKKITKKLNFPDESTKKMFDNLKAIPEFKATIDEIIKNADLNESKPEFSKNVINELTKTYNEYIKLHPEIVRKKGNPTFRKKKIEPSKEKEGEVIEISPAQTPQITPPITPTKKQTEGHVLLPTDDELVKFLKEVKKYNDTQARYYLNQHREKVNKEYEEQHGAGKQKYAGLYNDQIEKYMKHYKKYGWKGVYSIDEIHKIPISPKMSFIFNTDPSYKSGEHWIGVYIDTIHNKEIGYYDSYGEDPSPQFLKQMKILIDKLKVPVYLKMKINKIVSQRANSFNCGYFSMKFLIDHYEGKPFVACSGYNNSKNGEHDIQAFKKKFAKFEYI
jgi:hypothetical protein